MLVLPSFNVGNGSRNDFGNGMKMTQTRMMPSLSWKHGFMMSVGRGFILNITKVVTANIAMERNDTLASNALSITAGIVTLIPVEDVSGCTAQIAHQ